MFQSSAHALYFYNQTDETLHYVVSFRKKGTSETFHELNVERVVPGGGQKLKFKDSIEAKKFLDRRERIIEGLEEEASLKEGRALEVIIRIKKLGGAESENPVIYDETLCILENLNHLIRLHDLAHGDFCKDENNTYTLKLTGL